MSDKTDALLNSLLSDLSLYLDSYQLNSALAGKDLWPDATTEQAQCYALVKSLLKKYNEKPSPSKSACEGALKKFLFSNDQCKTWRLALENSSDEVLLGGVKASLWNFWNENGYDLVSSWDELHASGALGKGMNIYARDSDLYTKLYDSRLSCTDGNLSFVWEKLCARDPRWLDAEEQRELRYGTHIVAGNKLSFVNKNVTVARCICTEPTLNLWFQLGLGAHFERRLSSYYGVDLSNQPLINGALAREGSKTGRYATIDLESASDSISVTMLHEILPPKMMAWLMRLRSPNVQLPDGQVVELNMVSSMGNGFTFPLETAIFCAVVASVYSSRGYSLERRGRAAMRNFGVFGDDIIVLSELAPLVIRVLNLLGFRVNAGKTFIEGAFRESCGQDYYNGSWCRGVYVKRLRTSQDAYVAINNLNRWSALTSIALPETVGWLMRWCKRVLFVPFDEADDSGVKVPLDMALDVDIRSNGLVSYRRSLAVATTLSIELDENSNATIVCEKGTRERTVNPMGLLLCFLHGSVKGYRIALRQRVTRYTTRRRVTSSWDTLSPKHTTCDFTRISSEDSPLSLMEWRTWSGFVRRNVSPGVLKD